MIIGIACTIVLGILAAWQTRQVAHYKLVSRLLAHDYTVERMKRKALDMTMGDITMGLERRDAKLCAHALSAARRVATDDTDETIRKLGFVIPERPR